MQTQPDQESFYDQERVYDAESLDIEVRTDSQRVTVRLSGELDFYSAPELRDTVKELTGDHGRLVVLDLADLTLCDAGGITAMLQTHRSVAAAGGRLVIRGASGLVRSVLSVTGADKTLHLR